MTLALLGGSGGGRGGCGGDGKAHRKKHSSSRPRHTTTQNIYPSQSTLPVYSQQEFQSLPQYYGTSPPISSKSPPHSSRHSPGHHSAYNTPEPSPPYGSPPQNAPMPHVGQSKVSLSASPPVVASKRSYCDLRGTLASQANKSVNNLIVKPTALLSKKSTQALNQGAALCDRISSKFDTIMTSIDGERFSGNEQDLEIDESSSDPYSSSSTLVPINSHRGQTGYPVYQDAMNKKGSNHFSKVWLYSNSRLPPHLPPFKVYMPTWPLVCLAASYSERVYTPPNPRKSECETHIPSDWKSGTKAMVLKSVPIDDMNTVVFAIRGSATFMDWAVNYRSAPSSPLGFLDDPGNLCHSGFLYVARKMIPTVAERLRTLLQENPTRSHCSLLITGHSAGGAVAALIYAHMMSVIVQSELTYLTGFFKRVHCITFGAPPVSLLPLQRCNNERRHRKSLFYSFINEGDPVPRADKQVVRSLLKLYASPAPTSICNATMASLSKLNLSSTPSQTTLQTNASKPSMMSKFSKTSGKSTSTMSTLPSWDMPATTLSAAGRLVVIREKVGTKHGGEDVEAVTVDDELLRTVVYGDPMKHMMTLYKKRMEILATRAVTAGGF